VCVCVYFCVVSLAALRVHLPVCAVSLHTKQRPWDASGTLSCSRNVNSYVPCNLRPVSSSVLQQLFTACALSLTFEMSALKSFHLFIKCISIQNWNIWKFSSEFTTAFLMGAVFSVSTADEAQGSQPTPQSCPVSRVGTNRRVDLVLPLDGQAVCVM